MNKNNYSMSVECTIQVLILSIYGDGCVPMITFEKYCGVSDAISDRSIIYSKYTIIWNILKIKV